LCPGCWPPPGAPHTCRGRGQLERLPGRQAAAPEPVLAAGTASSGGRTHHPHSIHGDRLVGECRWAAPTSRPASAVGAPVHRPLRLAHQQRLVRLQLEAHLRAPPGKESAAAPRPSLVSHFRLGDGHTAGLLAACWLRREPALVERRRALALLAHQCAGVQSWTWGCQVEARSYGAPTVQHWSARRPLTRYACGAQLWRSAPSILGTRCSCSSRGPSSLRRGGSRRRPGQRVGGLRRAAWAGPVGAPALQLGKGWQAGQPRSQRGAEEAPRAAACAAMEAPWRGRSGAEAAAPLDLVLREGAPGHVEIRDRRRQVEHGPAAEGLQELGDEAQVLRGRVCGGWRPFVLRRQALWQRLREAASLACKYSKRVV
jgi:hypothetical protein